MKLTIRRYQHILTKSPLLLCGLLLGLSATSIVHAAASEPAHVLTLEGALKLATEKNETLQAYDKLKEAAEFKSASADLELSPYLSAKAGLYDDKKLTLQPAFQGDRTQAKQISLGMAKKFESGTSAQLSYGDQFTEISGTSFPIPAYWNSSLSLGLSQNLWKNAFGRSTRLRHEREQQIAKIETLAQIHQAKNLRLQIEQAYWTYIFAKEDKRLKEESLKRAERLLQWTSKRVSNGLADRSDFLQVNALLGSRSLQLISADDDAKAAQKTLETFLATDLTSFKIEDDLRHARLIKIEIGMLRMDALLSVLEAAVKSKAVEEAADGLNPDLNLLASLATNGQKATFGSSLGAVSDTTHPTWSMGVEFTLNLDRAQTHKVTQALSLESTAARLKAQTAKRDSDTSRTELLRRHEELNSRISQAEKLLDIQREKAARERDRLERGRTVTFQVINFEQEQSEAEALLLKLLTEQRKLEATSALFVPENFGG